MAIRRKPRRLAQWKQEPIPANETEEQKRARWRRVYGFPERGKIELETDQQKLERYRRDYGFKKRPSIDVAYPPKVKKAPRLKMPDYDVIEAMGGAQRYLRNAFNAMLKKYLGRKTSFVPGDLIKAERRRLLKKASRRV